MNHFFFGNSGDSSESGDSGQSGFSGESSYSGEFEDRAGILETEFAISLMVLSSKFCLCLHDPCAQF